MIRKESARLSGKNNTMQETFLVADVGGTNTTFAFVTGSKGRSNLVEIVPFKSKEIKDFSLTVSTVLARGKLKGYSTTKACFAGAGIVSEKNDFGTITKLPWNIDAQEIRRKTSLTSVLIINDFIAVAYGVGVMPAKSILVIKPGKISPQKPKAILGAGTGLGEAVLVWNKNRYYALASEGGYSCAALQTTEEYALGEFIKQLYRRERVVWEDLLSGKGISNVYQFFQARLPADLKIQKSNYDPALISKSADPASKATMNLFLRFYARCAQNRALDTLALGGVYLAGGIVAKNLALFQRKEFRAEFILHHRMKKVLEQIPVCAVMDYNISLYGAAHALQLYLKGDFP